MDQELQQQQQQERQQRLQQEVQRQPAGLQSLFGALNPFHLFGGGAGRGPPGAAAAAGNAGSGQNMAGPEVPVAEGADRLPAGTVDRLESVQTALRELEVCLPAVI